MMSAVICGAAFSFVAVLLQGCGGGSDGPRTTTLTTTPPVGPSGLPWCESIGTYYKVTFSNGTDQYAAAGQCLPSIVPGAYYTKAGEKDFDGKSDRPWSCFSPNFDPTLWTNAAARARNPPFEGACLFKDYRSTATPESVEDCSKHLSHHPSVCAPGPSIYWGACWSHRSENWKCIPKDDQSIPNLAKGDCKAAVLLEPGSSVPTQYFYDGLCHFPEEDTKLYKCDTVPGYSQASGSTCGQTVDTTDDKACFSLVSTQAWQCVAKGNDFNQPCSWTVTPDPKEFYYGACVFPSNKKYTIAVDASNLTATSTHRVIV